MFKNIAMKHSIYIYAINLNIQNYRHTIEIIQVEWIKYCSFFQLRNTKCHYMIKDAYVLFREPIKYWNECDYGCRVQILFEIKHRKRKKDLCMNRLL